MRNIEAGLTLVELLVTVALVGVLTAIAVPSFRTFMVKQSVNSSAQAFVSDMRLARAEAVKRARRITICASSNQTSCIGTWQEGWIIFVPTLANGSWTNGDTILRVQTANSVLASIAPIGGAAPASYIFEATGLSRGAASTLFFTPVAPIPSSSTRLVCVSAQGRATLRVLDAAACA